MHNLSVEKLLFYDANGAGITLEVKISSVEPTQSIGDIVPNSVPPGIAVQAGDAVVYPN